MSKFFKVTKASELDEINKQIEELQKRKQQLESGNKYEQILKNNIGKYLICTPDDYSVWAEDKYQEIYRTDQIEKALLFNSEQEAKNKFYSELYSNFSDYFPDDEDEESLDEDEIDQKIQQELDNDSYRIVKITENNISLDKEGRINSIK